jgi:integrase
LKARKPELKGRYFDEIERHLMNHASSLHKLPLKSVTQLNIANLLNKIEAERGPVAPNRTRASLSQFFSWVLSEGIDLPKGNPVTHTRKRAERSRDRVLTDDELRRIWNACNPTECYGAIVRLLILTGQRRDEIASLRCAEVEDGQINLPKARTKNKRPHIVPLSDVAKEILDRFPRKDRETVFGETGMTGYGALSQSKKKLDERIGKIEPWTLHDVRRTAVTGMAELGVQPHVIEAVVNHVSGHKGGVAGIYNRASYEPEKRAALNLWAEHLLAVDEGRKAVLVPMKRA